ncbi:MAG: hypothetical protein ABSD29_16955 [Verrucomicrobiota bacterium]|jgi:hypothetical protein
MNNYISAAANIPIGPPAAVRATKEQTHVLRSMMSGDATWIALKQAVAELTRIAPQDHDVLVQVGDVLVLKARFIEPHAFLFEGINQDGHSTGIVIHFSQLAARVVYLPKRGPSRVITGFSNAASA